LELADGFTILLRDVLYVPSLHTNLISVSCLDKDHYEFYFGEGKCAIWFNNAYVGVSLLHNKIYLLSLHEKVYSRCQVDEHVSASDKEQKKKENS
jgi:hypothetical protein